MTSLTCMTNFKSLVFVIHSKLMIKKYIAQSRNRTQACCVAGEDSTTEPTLLHLLHGLKKLFNHYQLHILHSQVNLLLLQMVLLLNNQGCISLLFISHGLKFMRKEISFFLRGRMARGAALSKKKFPFWWALAHQKWNFVQIFLRGCAPVPKMSRGGWNRFGDI